MLRSGKSDSMPRMRSPITPLTEDKGVTKQVLKEGFGPLIPKDVKAVVHYTGRLESGVVFDCSRDRNVPFKFNLGKKEVISGWDLGVSTMKKGEVILLTCDSKYAYGNTGVSGIIPGGATLVFEVELLGWESVCTLKYRLHSNSKFDYMQALIMFLFLIACALGLYLQYRK